MDRVDGKKKRLQTYVLFQKCIVLLFCHCLASYPGSFFLRAWYTLTARTPGGILKDGQLPSGGALEERESPQDPD